MGTPKKPDRPGAASTESGRNPSHPLLYADTVRSADALYFGRVSVPDPFVAFGLRGRKIAIVSALEFGRVRRESDFDSVLALEDFLDAAGKTWTDRKPGPVEVITLAARRLRIRRFTVPRDFPAAIYQGLLEQGLRLEIAPGPLFPSRELKTRAEAAAIREGNRCSARGIAAAEQVLRASRARGRRLFWRGSVLTSERLRSVVDGACLEAGSVASETIVAGGDQACDPHNRGSGPLRPGELIIVDVFPRVARTGYHGDMTRTFLRGRAGDAQRALVGAVRTAQKAALRSVRAGVNGREVHARVTDVFARLGFATRRTSRGSVGFFHGTGHGLGLDIHEAPRVGGSADSILAAGTVVTIEPGLYYPGLGACRIEDVVQVTDTGCRMLSRSPYDWELR